VIKSDVSHNHEDSVKDLTVAVAGDSTYKHKCSILGIFFIHISVSHFRDLIPTFIIFRTLFCYQTKAAEHSVPKTSEETGRNPKGLHKENLGFVYNRLNQSQRLHLQHVLQVFTSTLVVAL